MRATILILALLFQHPSSPVIKTAASANLIHSVSLRWTPSTTPGVSYTVYRCIAGTGQCGTTGVGWLKLNPAYFYGTSFNDNSVAAGVSYNYHVTAYNGLESPPSGNFLIKVPSP